MLITIISIRVYYSSNKNVQNRTSSEVAVSPTIAWNFLLFTTHRVCMSKSFNPNLDSPSNTKVGRPWYKVVLLSVISHCAPLKRASHFQFNEILSISSLWYSIMASHCALVIYDFFLFFIWYSKIFRSCPPSTIPPKTTITLPHIDLPCFQDL